MYRKRLLPLVILMVLIQAFILGSSVAQDDLSNGDPLSNLTFQHLVDKANAEGSVQVIIGLNTSFSPENVLTQQAVTAQRQNIRTAQNNLLTSLQSYNVRILSSDWVIPFMSLEVDSTALNFLSNNPEVISITENIRLQPFLDSSTRVVGLVDNGGNRVVEEEGDNQTVVVIDTGADSTHPFFQQSGGGSRFVNEACFSLGTANFTLCPNGTESQSGLGSSNPLVDNCFTTRGDNTTPQLCDHGTHVAGIAAGNDNSTSFDGVARSADIISVQVFHRTDDFNDCLGFNPCVLTAFDDILDALNWVYTLPNRDNYNIAAINMSLGGGSFSGENCDDVSGVEPFLAIVDLLRDVDIATVVASGNGSQTAGVSFPACLSNVIAVGATTDNDVRASFSNTSVALDLYAPGFDIDSSIPITPINSAFDSFNGTSMAAPHVAGAWAILRECDPTATVDEIYNALNTTGVAINDSGNMTTRINIANALAALGCSTDTHPEIVPIPDQNMTVGNMLTVDVDVTNTNNVVIGFQVWAQDGRSIPPNSPFYTAQDNGNGSGFITFTARPGNVADAPYDVTVSAIDGSGRLSTETFQVEIEPNRPPVFTPIDDQTMEVRETLEITVMATDPDGDDVSFRTLGQANNLDFVTWDGVDTITFEPTLNDAGTYRIIIEASDGTQTKWEVFDLTVEAAPNEKPDVVPIPDQTLQVGEQTTVTVVATDADGDDIFYRVIRAASLPDFITWDGTDTFTIAPSSSDVGNYFVTVEASDGIDRTWERFEVIVEENQQPVFTPIADVWVRIGTTKTVTVEATDPEGEDITYRVIRAASLPDFITWDGTDTFTISPQVGDNGSYQITVQASDGVMRRWETFFVRVINP